MKKGGISKRNREMLSILNREAKGPFGLDFVSKVLNISKTRAKNFVFLLVSQGWLLSIKRQKVAVPAKCDQ